MRLLKTGQTTQYGGYLDDGYYQEGIAKAYTVLNTGQYTGTTSITINSKTDVHSNNCVLDVNTGLMWSRYVSASVGPASDGKLPWTTTGSGVTAEGIFAYVAAANVAKLAGYDDWRISNVLEVVSLLSCEQPYASPDAIAFPSWPLGAVWSSSSIPTGPTVSALYVDFGQFLIYYAAKSATTYVVLVRGGM